LSIHFYGFLHLEDREKSAVNVRAGSFKKQSRIYVLNALGLARSLRAHGYSFTLLTNDEDLIHEVAPDAAKELDLVTISFSTKVPSGVRFYSGHYKLDVFHHLSSLDKDYVALIDLDMLCINPAPKTLIDAIESKTGLFYDITNQVVPAYGEASIKDQLESILQRPTETQWSGGEFLAGTPEFFGRLARAAESIFERYLDVSVGKTRVGNEPYQNAALHILRADGVTMKDAGSLNVVRRFWNMPVKHPQPRFSHFAKSFLLHLPVDKHILVLINSFRLSRPESFLLAYRTLRWLWLPLEVFQRIRRIIEARLSR
jgi:hypothetical protein